LRSAKLGEYEESPQAMPMSVAVFGQALAGDPTAATQGRGLIERRGQAGGGVEVLGVGEPGDRQAVSGECRGPDDCDPRQAGQDLPVGDGELHLDLLLEFRDVDLEDSISRQVAAQPMGSLLSIARW
jgi:hypothetical protein